MHTVFEDRSEAGRRLAKRLSQFHGSSAVVVGIPRGGVPVAAAIAHRLQLEWNVIVARKLPIPANPEAGFGAVTPDGSVVMNDSLLYELHLSSKQVEQVINEQKAEACRRMRLYSGARLPANVSGRVAIVIDDGLASGFTALAAIESLRAQSALKIIAAAPVASRSASARVSEAADECVFEIVSPSVPFAVADFYIQWRDLTDDDVLKILQAP